MTREEKREAAKQWLDEKIEAYKLLGKEFNPEGDMKYRDCPNCIEVHPSDKQIHIVNMDALFEYIDYPRSYVKMSVSGRTYDKVSFNYRGYTFFQLEEAD